MFRLWKKTLNGIYKSDKSEEDEEIKTLYFYWFKAIYI